MKHIAVVAVAALMGLAAGTTSIAPSRGRPKFNPYDPPNVQGTAPMDAHGLPHPLEGPGHRSPPGHHNSPGHPNSHHNPCLPPHCYVTVVKPTPVPTTVRSIVTVPKPTTKYTCTTTNTINVILRPITIAKGVTTTKTTTVTNKITHCGGGHPTHHPVPPHPHPDPHHPCSPRCPPPRPCPACPTPGNCPPCKEPPICILCPAPPSKPHHKPDDRPHPKPCSECAGMWWNKACEHCSCSRSCKDWWKPGCDHCRPTHIHPAPAHPTKKPDHDIICHEKLAEWVKCVDMHLKSKNVTASHKKPHNCKFPSAKCGSLESQPQLASRGDSGSISKENALPSDLDFSKVELAAPAVPAADIQKRFADAPNAPAATSSLKSEGSGGNPPCSESKPSNSTTHTPPVTVTTSVAGRHSMSAHLGAAIAFLAAVMALQ
jgi:hypothetical protein